YEPLPKGSIRLLSLHPRCEPDDPIQCSLKIHQFDDSSLLSYVALSYVWGPTLPAFEIVVGGRNISVRKNLYDFLLQKTGNELLWIDALCIDQQNDQERNHQVERMGEIYKRADRVIAWLGL
ncbi:HET-domain-containing protein, partial [Lophiostoma macrostomum CBS 122681]